MAKLNIYNISRWEMAAQEAQYKVRSLCEKLGISTRQGRRYARKLFGKSIAEWLNDLRLRLAVGLLRKLPSVKAVYLALHFKHFGNFSNAFREYYGVSPTAFLDFCRKHEQDMRRYAQQRD